MGLENSDSMRARMGNPRLITDDNMGLEGSQTLTSSGIDQQIICVGGTRGWHHASACCKEARNKSCFSVPSFLACSVR
jgi:hypothetical protein